MPRYALNPAMAVLLRPEGTVQVGWDPRRAVLVHPPAGLTGPQLARLLRRLQVPVTAAELSTHTGDLDVPADTVTGLLDALVAAGVVTRTRPPRRSVSVRVHGRGPLSDLLTGSLRCSGTRVTRSSRRHAVVTAEHTDLVVLADALITDPRILRDLHAARVPHLPVRVRDGTGLVGPLVIPGLTSCLACADLHRSERDAAWPALAAQLRHAVTTADRATVLGTAALALTQVDLVLRAIRDGAGTEGPPEPITLDTTVEFDVSTGSVLTRRWSRHPACGC
ncbi:cyclodehydratase [Mycobacterium sp. MBM]|nr:cyclodehydratase [Mycobacterium sp. MBM]